MVTHEETYKSNLGYALTIHCQNVGQTIYPINVGSTMNDPNLVKFEMYCEHVVMYLSCNCWFYQRFHLVPHCWIRFNQQLVYLIYPSIVHIIDLIQNFKFLNVLTIYILYFELQQL